MGDQCGGVARTAAATDGASHSRGRRSARDQGASPLAEALAEALAELGAASEPRGAQRCADNRRGLTQRWARRFDGGRADVCGCGCGHRCGGCVRGGGASFAPRQNRSRERAGKQIATRCGRSSAGTLVRMDHDIDIGYKLAWPRKEKKMANICHDPPVTKIRLWASFGV